MSDVYEVLWLDYRKPLRMQKVKKKKTSAPCRDSCSC